MNSHTTFKATPYSELERLTEDHHKRWDVSSPELGVSLHAMQQLGHWQPFSAMERSHVQRMIRNGIDFHLWL